MLTKFVVTQLVPVVCNMTHLNRVSKRTGYNPQCSHTIQALQLLKPESPYVRVSICMVGQVGYEQNVFQFCWLTGWDRVNACLDAGKRNRSEAGIGKGVRNHTNVTELFR